MLSVGYYEKYSPLKDIDIDLAPSKRQAIFSAIRKEKGDLGLAQVSTFGTEGTKSTVLTACRGYRSKDYPEGIDSDIAQFLSSLIPQHRGFLWPLKDVVYGNEEEGRSPIRLFIDEVNKYPGLLNIMTAIEGLVNKRSSHASGVILYNNDPYETAAFMRTPSGDLVTQYDLYMAEAAGDTKYDFLATEVSDKIIKCIELLVEDGALENLSLRELYNKYLHPESIDTTDQRLWDALSSGKVLEVFQFNSGTGLEVVKKIKPQNPTEMTAANALMRLMSEKGQESQQDRFARIKQEGIETFYYEMKRAGLNEEECAAMSMYCDKYYGCVPLQEQMMQILMHKNLANFTLAEANDARKIVAKKQMSRIPELRERIYSKVPQNRRLADYIWKIAVAPSLGYAFSLNHSLPYSFVGIQTLLLATSFNSIYWNTACLIVNSGATDEESGGSTDYGKIAMAIGSIANENIKVSLANINKSGYGFRPDVENNEILFGLKGMLDIGDELIKTIIELRPYENLYDFINKVKPNKRAMVSLIKGGAFDKFGKRKFIMALYLWHTCDKKKRLTLQNFNGLIQAGLISEDLQWTARIFHFNKYLKTKCQVENIHYKFDAPAEKFYSEMFEGEELEYYDGAPHISKKKWETQYQNVMNEVRDWIKKNHDDILENYNIQIFKEEWDKYAKGTISAWEIESLCFYHSQHELAHLKKEMYGIVDFFSLKEEPVVEKFWQKNGIQMPLYKLYKICGTCIAKNKTKGTVALLTATGVVNVKFRNEYFSLFDKQISEKRNDGTKKVLEKSWFNRGNMILVQGIRKGDEFIAKKYSTTAGHQLYHIDEITSDGELKLRSERYQGVQEDEE